MKGYSSQVLQFPVVFEKGEGNTITDVDGNTYIDFSSGIYCNSTGHCHPKVVEKTREYLGRLMNCHDFTTPIKTLFSEKMAGVLPGDLNGIQLFCGGMDILEGTIDNEGTGAQAAFVMEPIQGYSGSIVYRDEILPRVLWICRKRGMLLIVDEILTGMGRTGRMFCVEHYDVVPDVIVFGKGTAGGFPLWRGILVLSTLDGFFYMYFNVAVNPINLKIGGGAHEAEV